VSTGSDCLLAMSTIGSCGLLIRCICISPTWVSAQAPTKYRNARGTLGLERVRHPSDVFSKLQSFTKSALQGASKADRALRHEMFAGSLVAGLISCAHTAEFFQTKPTNRQSASSNVVGRPTIYVLAASRGSSIPAYFLRMCKVCTIPRPILILPS
jgi:hypothetical protein